MMSITKHKSGFIHLVGSPNAGKSTLFNLLVPSPLSIVTPKPQTTRQEIIGMTNTTDVQAIYVDTPGHIEARNALQRGMLKSIERSIPGADLLLYVVDAHSGDVDMAKWGGYVKGIRTFLVFNKVDALAKGKLKSLEAKWGEVSDFAGVFFISAHEGTQVQELVKAIEAHLPYHAPFYDKEDISVQPIRFFVAECIRKVIFLQYKQEVPYSTAVVVTRYKEEEEDMIFVDATIYTERLSQKKILIGKHGQALERLCKKVRGELGAFLGKRVFFKPYVKVLENWRESPKILEQLGYV